MIDKIKVPVSVDLGSVDVTIKELLDLKSGDVINIGKSVKDKLIVNVSDQRKFYAMLVL